MATARDLEVREKKWWEKQGFTVEIAWAAWQYGRKWPSRRDFFAMKDGNKFKKRSHGFDLLAVKVINGKPMQAMIQVSKTSGKGANADHGDPRWSWIPPESTVEDWATNPSGVVQVVSIVDGKNTTRNWWVKRQGGKRKKGLDLFA